MNSLVPAVYRTFLWSAHLPASLNGHDGRPLRGVSSLYPLSQMFLDKRFSVHFLMREELGFWLLLWETRILILAPIELFV